MFVFDAATCMYAFKVCEHVVSLCVLNVCVWAEEFIVSCVWRHSRQLLFRTGRCEMWVSRRWERGGGGREVRANRPHIHGDVARRVVGYSRRARDTPVVALVEGQPRVWRGVAPRIRYVSLRARRY